MEGPSSSMHHANVLHSIAISICAGKGKKAKHEASQENIPANSRGHIYKILSLSFYQTISCLENYDRKKKKTKCTTYEKRFSTSILPVVSVLTLSSCVAQDCPGIEARVMLQQQPSQWLVHLHMPPHQSMFILSNNTPSIHLLGINPINCVSICQEFIK